jgi:hypothetical protein
MNSRSLRAELASFQNEQFRHDRVAHGEMLALPLHRRLAHFTLHFTKYQAVMLSSSKNSSTDPIARLVTDSLIILLAAANALGVRLRAEPNGESQADGGSINHQQLLYSYIETVGEMAKACEAFDHIKNFPSELVFKAALARLTAIVFGMAELHGVDLLATVPKRWDQVERKLSVSRRHVMTSFSPESAVA